MGFFKTVKNIIKSELNKDKRLEKSFIEYDEILNEEETQTTIKNEKEKEYYEILEVEYGESFNKIKSSYKKLLKKYHPDFFRNDKEKYEKAVKISKKINEAYSYFERKNIWTYF